jgi:lipid II isoglutaminyl synthase (glutamine-hydrolysing)
VEVEGDALVSRAAVEPLRVGLVYPELLGTYGDRGNGEVLAWRARRRGLAAEIVEVPASAPVPCGLDAYLLGGGEDAAQATVAELLRSPAGDGLRRAVAEDRVVLAVCGAFQLLGRTYTDASGRRTDGLGLLDLDTRAALPRLVGEVVVRTREGELLTGFENHGGRTWLGRGVEPLGRVLRGSGNNQSDGVEGVRSGALVGTYLHGPVLARNPFLADLLLRAMLVRRGAGRPTLEPLAEDRSRTLHDARLEASLTPRPHRSALRARPR